MANLMLVRFKPKRLQLFQGRLTSFLVFVHKLLYYEIQNLYKYCALIYRHMITAQQSF